MSHNELDLDAFNNSMSHQLYLLHSLTELTDTRLFPMGCYSYTQTTKQLQLDH